MYICATIAVTCFAILCQSETCTAVFMLTTCVCVWVYVVHCCQHNNGDALAIACTKLLLPHRYHTSWPSLKKHTHIAKKTYIQIDAFNYLYRQCLAASYSSIFLHNFACFCRLPLRYFFFTFVVASNALISNGDSKRNIYCLTTIHAKLVYIYAPPYVWKYIVKLASISPACASTEWNVQHAAHWANHVSAP